MFLLSKQWEVGFLDPQSICDVINGLWGVHSRHTTSKRCCYDAFLTFWCRSNVHATSFWRRVPDGMLGVSSCNVNNNLILIYFWIFAYKKIDPSPNFYYLTALLKNSKKRYGTRYRWGYITLWIQAMKPIMCRVFSTEYINCFCWVLFKKVGFYRDFSADGVKAVRSDHGVMPT